MDQAFLDYLENGMVKFDIFVNPAVEVPASKVDSNNGNIRKFLGATPASAAAGSSATIDNTPGAIEVTTESAQRAAAEQALAAEKEKVRQLEAKVKQLEAQAAGTAAPATGGSAKEQQLEAEIAKLKADLAAAPQSSACTIL